MRAFVRRSSLAGECLERLDTTGDGTVTMDEWCESIYGTWENSEKGAEMSPEIREKAVMLKQKKYAEREAESVARVQAVAAGQSSDEEDEEAPPAVEEAAPVKPAGMLVLPRNEFAAFATDS